TFGIYFALKLVGAGKGCPSAAKPILLALLAIVVCVGGGFALRAFGTSPAALLGFALFAIGAIIPAAGWKDLFKVLVAYAFAARIPVLIVMFFALRGDWHTHYDAVPEKFGGGFWLKFLEIAFLPQMILWIAYTVVVGTLFGAVVAAFVRREKKVPVAA